MSAKRGFVAHFDPDQLEYVHPFRPVFSAIHEVLHAHGCDCAAVVTIDTGTEVVTIQHDQTCEYSQ